MRAQRGGYDAKTIGFCRSGARRHSSDVKYTFQKYVEESGLERSLLELVNTRASQINGCAYCIDMHAKDARVLGESEQRLYRAEKIDTEAGFRGLKGERRKLL